MRLPYIMSVVRTFRSVVRTFKRVMRAPKKPPLANKHIEEHLKLGAGCLQALALALAGAAIVAPLILTRTSLDWRNILAAFIAGVFESAAFVLLRYIPVTVP